MTPAEILADSFARIRESAEAALDGLSVDELRHRPGPEANPIGWLVWHLARVQDDHVADVAGAPQVYPDFVERFALPYDTTAIGYGQSSQEVGDFSAPADLLGEYLAAVHEKTLTYLETLAPEELDRVVDDRWDPPVTLGARLVSVVNDDTQHVGQAAYVRGLLGR
ncbi:DUF664 domain-containing protein [soil metagenome]